MIEHHAWAERMADLSRACDAQEKERSGIRSGERDDDGDLDTLRGLAIVPIGATTCERKYCAFRMDDGERVMHVHALIYISGRIAIKIRPEVRLWRPRRIHLPIGL